MSRWGRGCYIIGACDKGAPPTPKERTILCARCAQEVDIRALRCSGCGAPFQGLRRAPRLAIEARYTADDDFSIEYDEEVDLLPRATGGVGISFELEINPEPVDDE